MLILALDPSVMNRCGWATVHLEWEHGPTLPLARRGHLTVEEWNWGFFEISGMNFQMRCADLRDWIEQSPLGLAEFDVLVCEWPTYYDSAKGQIAAQQGYTVNLAGIAMYVAGWFHVQHQNLFLYTAPDWKGTVKKAVTARRFFKLFGLSEMQEDHNAIDACMMLVYHCRKVGLTPNT
jgi:hypothetical protein